MSSNVNKARRLVIINMMNRAVLKFTLLVNNVNCRIVVTTSIVLMVILIVLLIFVTVSVVTNMTCLIVRLVLATFVIIRWKVLFMISLVTRRRRIVLVW